MTRSLKDVPPGAVVLGKTSRGKYIYQPEKMRAIHTLLVGCTGSGKSSGMQSMIRQDITVLDDRKRGVIVFDPHGNGVEAVTNFSVTHSLYKDRVIRILDPSSDEFVFSLNVFRRRPGVDPAVIASAFTNAVMKVWGGDDPRSTPQLRQALKAFAITAVELEWTLVEAVGLFSLKDDLGMRAYAIEHVTHPIARQFWLDLEALRPGERQAVVGSAMRRLNEFVLPATMRRIFGPCKESLDIRQCMDDGDVVLVNLSFSEGKFSEDEATLLGTLLLSEIFLACLGRPEGATPVYLYIDEAAKFMSSDVAAILDQSRKYSLHAVLAIQRLGQAVEAGQNVVNALMTNARTMIVYEVPDPEEATTFAKLLFRGQLDLQKPKERFTRPVVVGQRLEWLLSESSGIGTAHANGRSRTLGFSQAEHESTTTSASETWSTATSESVSDTQSQSTTKTATRSVSQGESASEGVSQSKGRARSRGSARSAGRTTSESTSETETEGRSANRVEAVNNSYRVEVEDTLMGSSEEEFDDHLRRSVGTSESTGNNSSRAASRGRTTGTSTGEQVSEGESDSVQSGHTAGRGRSSGDSKSDGVAEARGTARSETSSVTEGYSLSLGTSETTGTTQTVSAQHGTSETETRSASNTRGRAQSYVSEFEERPTSSYTLEELVYLAATKIAQQAQGRCIVKIGRRPPAPISVTRIAPGWARPERIALVKRKLALACPFIMTLEEADELYRQRCEHFQQLLSANTTEPENPDWG